MSSSNEVYRSVNKYIDYTTGQEYLVYCEPSEKRGTAKLRGTLNAYPNGKGRKTRTYSNKGGAGYHPGYVPQDEITSYFEYADTWVERATEWELI